MLTFKVLAVLTICTFSTLVTSQSTPPRAYLDVASRLGWQPRFDMDVLEKVILAKHSPETWNKVKGVFETAQQVESKERTSLGEDLEATNSSDAREKLAMEYIQKSYDRAGKLIDLADEFLTPDELRAVIERSRRDLFNMYDPFYQEYLGMSRSTKEKTSELLRVHAQIHFTNLRDSERAALVGEERSFRDLQVKWGAVSRFMAILTPEQQRKLLECTLRFPPGGSKSDLKAMLESQFAERFTTIPKREMEKTIASLTDSIKEF